MPTSELAWIAAGDGYAIARGFLRPAALTSSEYGRLVQVFNGGSAYFATRFLRGAGATAMAERVRHTPVPPGGYEANPLLSAQVRAGAGPAFEPVPPARGAR